MTFPPFVECIASPTSQINKAAQRENNTLWQPNDHTENGLDFWLCVPAFQSGLPLSFAPLFSYGRNGRQPRHAFGLFKSILNQSIFHRKNPAAKERITLFGSRTIIPKTV
jgi:hypothetical protein